MSFPCFLCHALLFQPRGGGVEKKFLVLAYSFFFGGYPRRGRGVRKKKFARKFFPDPKT